MPHFFISSKDINSDIAVITDSKNYHHIARVLRAKTGEMLTLIDENQTQYKVVIEKIDSKSITTKVAAAQKSSHYLNLQLILVQGVLKNDAQNLVVQKATELGVPRIIPILTELGIKEIVPVITDNCVIKQSTAAQKSAKWQKIANEAAKQCERSDYLKVLPAVSLDDIINSSDYDIKIACVERTQKLPMKACLRNIKVNSDDKIAVIIGPEGGFSARELQLLEHAGDIYKVSLGNLILRAETAAITALSNVIYELEDDTELH